jgi:hypothetical protein
MPGPGRRGVGGARTGPTRCISSASIGRFTSLSTCDAVPSAGHVLASMSQGRSFSSSSTSKPNSSKQVLWCTQKCATCSMHCSCCVLACNRVQAHAS